MSAFGVFLVRIFSHSDWIRRDAEYLSIFSLNAGKCRPEKFQKQTLWAVKLFTFDLSLLLEHIKIDIFMQLSQSWLNKIGLDVNRFLLEVIMQRSACRPIGFTLVVFLFDKISMKSRALFMELVFAKQTSAN